MTPDRALVLRALSGEDDAYGELVRRHQTSVFNVCYRMLGRRAPAEDMAQEALVRAYRKLDTFDVDRPFGPWVRKVATNVCLNHLARTRATGVAVDGQRALHVESPEANPAAAAERAHRAEAVRAAIAALPPHYRAVIELRHFQELTYLEIADTLRIPLSDVKSHLFRARKALAGQLKAEV